MNNNDLVAKLWKLCDNLRDGGVSYQNYVNELASLLFLKMCKETGQEADYLPEGYRWDDLKSRIGQDQMQFYRNLLVQLGTQLYGRAGLVQRQPREVPRRLRRYVRRAAAEER